MKTLKLVVALVTVCSLTLLILLFLIAKRINYPPKLLINTIGQAYKQKDNIPSNINFLILGVDQRSDWLETSQDTDTIIFANLNTDNFNLNLISLPRDIWFKPTSSRINKIYQLSFNQEDPTDFVKQSFKTIVGLPIDHLIVIDTKILVPLLKAVGPLEINLKNGFIDDRYPDPNHITDPDNYPNPYMTISFDQGINTINHQNILYFVRSRKGTETIVDGGTDIGRAHRQQLLLESIFQKLKQTKSNQFVSLMSLYQIWNQQIQKDIDDQTILSIVFKNKFNINKLNLSSTGLPIQDDLAGTVGVIYHPTYFSNNAWVYLPIEPDFSSIHQFVDQQIN